MHNSSIAQTYSAVNGGFLEKGIVEPDDFEALPDQVRRQATTAHGRVR